MAPCIAVENMQPAHIASELSKSHIRRYDTWVLMSLKQYKVLDLMAYLLSRGSKNALMFKK